MSQLDTDYVLALDDAEKVGRYFYADLHAPPDGHVYVVQGHELEFIASLTEKGLVRLVVSDNQFIPPTSIRNQVIRFNRRFSPHPRPLQAANMTRSERSFTPAIRWPEGT